MDLKGVVFRQPEPVVWLLALGACQRGLQWVFWGIPFFSLRMEFQIHCHWHRAFGSACMQAKQLNRERSCCFPSSFGPYLRLTAGKSSGRSGSQNWLTRVLSSLVSDTLERSLESMSSVICQQLDCHWMFRDLNREPKYVWCEDYLWDQILACCKSAKVALCGVCLLIRKEVEILPVHNCLVFFDWPSNDTHG